VQVDHIDKIGKLFMAEIYGEGYQQPKNWGRTVAVGVGG
jgi:hypothetical protein